MKRVFSIYILLITAAFAMVGCNKEQQLFDGTDNGLTSFSVISNGVTYNAAIIGNEIKVSAPVGTDLSSAEVKYELCEHASITPDPKTIKDWNSQHVFRTKSYTKVPREYTYSVLRTDVSQAGNVQLLTQTDVENFAKLGVTVINGNLIIGSDSKPVQDSIIDVEALSSLKEVRYNIIVNRSFAGGTLKGLENIEKCGGLFLGTTTSQVVFPALSGISIDLPKLQSTGDIILNSSSIKSIDLRKLESVVSLYVASNSLIALKVPMLRETVSGLNLDNKSNSINSILSEVSFPQLEKVGGKFSMQYFSGLTTIGVPKLKYVGGDVNVTLNSGVLEDLIFPELEMVNGAIVVEKAPGLLKLSIPKVKHVASFTYNKPYSGSYPLEQLDLSSLETIDNEIYVRDVVMDALTLPKLTEVGGDVTFWDLKVATTISMPLIKKIGKKLQLYSASMLETLDVSTLDTLAHLELIGCTVLKMVKSPATIGDLTLNYASNATCSTPIFEGLLNIDGWLMFTSDSKTALFEIKNIKKIATLKFGGGATGAVLNLYDTEEIGMFDLSSSNIQTLNAPKLTEVKNLKFSSISKLTTLIIPQLKTVGTFALSEHGSWNSSSARMTDLNAFSGITSIGSVAVSYCNKLVDFSGLSGALPALDASKWSVLNCGYNPTYQNMIDGKYVKP